MKPTKIFVDAHVFDGIPQGTTTFLRGLYTSFVNHSDFECILGAHHVDTLKNYFPDPRFQFATLPDNGKVKRLLIDFPKIIKEKDIDYAHFQYVLPIRKTCKEVVTVHDVLFLDFPHLFPLAYRVARKIAFAHAVRRSELVTTVSQYSKASLIKHFGVDPDKIVVTPNGIINEFIRTPEDEPDIKVKYGLHKYILYVSRIEPRKNHIGLLRAFVDLELYKKDYTLVLVGSSGIQPKELSHYYNQLPDAIKKSVRFISNVPKEDLGGFYKHCDLFVYPSLAEGFGIPPLEAVCMGATTLCSNQTAMSDFSFLGEKLFNPLDENELKEKIIFFLNHPSTAETLTRERNEILRRYNWDNSAAILADSIRKIF